MNKLNEYITDIFKENYLSISSGLIMGLVFAPFDHIYFLVYFALVPFFIDLKTTQSISTAIQKGYWFGFFSAVSALNWVAFNTISGFIAVLVIHPWTYVLFAFFFYVFWKRLLSKAIFPLSVLWIVLEAARSWGQLRFPWINLYYSLSYDVNFIQVIEYTGPLFLSFFIVLANFMFMLVFLKWKNEKKVARLPLGILVLMFCVWIGLSVNGIQRLKQLRSVSYPVLKAGIAQPDINPYEKWQPQMRRIANERLLNYSDSLAENDCQLIVWPETAIPSYIRNNPSRLFHLRTWVNSHKIPLITGIPDFEWKDNRYRFYNAILMLKPSIPDFDVYYKHVLVPGGETIPFKNYFPILEKIDVGGGNFWPGKELKTLNYLFRLPPGRFAAKKWTPIAQDTTIQSVEVRTIPAICYESVFPELMRTQKINSDGNLIAVITNDGWYGNTAGPYQHFRASVLRAIETRTSVIRSANNGISGFIDFCGDIFQETTLFTEDHRWAYLPISNITTVYERYGSLWIWWLAALALIFIVYTEIFHHSNSTTVDKER